MVTYYLLFLTERPKKVSKISVYVISNFKMPKAFALVLISIEVEFLISGRKRKSETKFVLSNDDRLLVVLSVSRSEFYDWKIHFELSVIQSFWGKTFWNR